MKPFDGRIGKKLPEELKSDLRFFAFYIGNGTVLSGTKWGVEYDISKIYEPSPNLGSVFSIFMEKYDSKGKIRKLETGVSETTGLFIQSFNEKNSFKLPDLDKNSGNFRDVIIKFASDFGLRKIDTLPLESLDIDYGEDLIDYGSGFERLITIFTNVIRMDKNFKVINEEWARFRASQFIRYYHDSDYRIKPKLKDWETELA